MKTAPYKGTKDYLPAEQRVRDYVQNEIIATYRASGFERIGTPILEDMENLDKSDGGDNLNLIFKILKRGDKLEKALAAASEKELSDIGLRYDLTLPLTRFYAAYREQLPMPFKAIQTDKVFRAERPQRGRLREFVQCDIDVFGDATPNAEVELIDVTARALLGIGFSDFVIHINDRRLLRGMLASFGFAAETLDTVCVSFDKMDKIGADGVAKELCEKGMPRGAVAQLGAFLAKGTFSLADVSALCADAALGENMQYIINTVAAVAKGAYRVEYTPSLVRGQGYYTGVVFEIYCPQFGGAVGGGGRYDGMVEKFVGQSVPAVGFSIGFERICALLLEQGFVIPTQKKALALLYDAQDGFAQVLQTAEVLREQYDVSVLPAAKKVGKQIEKLQQNGIAAICFAAKYPEIKML